MIMTIKVVKLILGVIVCVLIIFVLNALIYELAEGLIRTVRHALPLNGFTAVICMYLITVLSISIVAVIGGFFDWVSLKMIRLGAITYIVLDLLTSIKSYTSASLQVTGGFSPLVPALMSIFNAIILLVALASSRKLYLAGRKLRGKIRKSQPTSKNNS